MVAWRTLGLLLGSFLVFASGCSKSEPAITCQKFIRYDGTEVNVEALKIAVTAKKLPIKVELGKFESSPKSLRDASEKIQALDVAQFGSCQAINALPVGRDRDEATKNYSKSMNGLIDALYGSKDPKVSIRLDGSDDGVRASNLTLDLGYIAANAEAEYRLRITALGDPVNLQAQGAESGVRWRWASNSVVEEVTRASGNLLVLTVNRPGISAEKAPAQSTAVVRLATEDRAAGDITITVKYSALAPVVSLAASSGPQWSGTGQDFSGIYSTCVDAPTPGNYQLTGSAAGGLTGDRGCNAYSTCAYPPDPAGKHICLAFTLQGHSENGSKAQSEGHINASFALTPSTPTLVAKAF